MGSPDNFPEDADRDSRSAAIALQGVTQDLKALHQDLLAHMSQDVQRLRAEKSRLLNDIEKLRDQREMLMSEQDHLLSQKQIAQQQAWAKQLAQAMATHLQAVLVKRLSQQQANFNVPATAPTSETGLSALGNQPGGEASLASVEDETTQRLLVSLDTTLNRTLNSLRQDLTSYHSSLSQQINRMQTLEQQGEAILEALVKRLGQQLQQDLRQDAGISPGTSGNGGMNGGAALPFSASTPPLPKPPSPLPAAQRNGTPPHPNGTARILATSPAIAPEPAVASIRPKPRIQQLSQFQLGLMMILLSTVALSLHNVVVGIIGNPSDVLGLFQLGGYIRLNSLGNSLLILWMRMLLVVPLMVGLSTFLYPAVWRDLKKFFQSRDRALLMTVVGSGFFLFLSQVMIYIAIGQIGPGVAVTILFMYPLATVPLAWVLFGDRPTSIRLGVMVAISLGVILTALPRLTTASPNPASNSALGLITAVISGLAFACYLISMQISFRKLHPVPVSMIQFVSIFLLTSLCLIFLPLGITLEPENWGGFLISGIILGALTLIGYLLNNFGVRFMGAAMASIIASSGPVLTALLAFLITPSDRTALQSVQILGILVVTLGVAALSLEKLLLQRQSANPPRPIR